MSQRLATVDLRGDEYVVVGMSKTEAGFWIGDAGFVRLAATASAGELGDALRAALDRSRTDVETPPRDAEPVGDLLAAVGAKNYAAYMRGTRQVEVFAEDGDQGEALEITPTRNGGAGSGFTPLTDQVVTLTFDAPSQIGAAVIAALANCTA